MGKIDKEKLLEKINNARCADEIRSCIKNFPEEPEIDFDALYEEFRDTGVFHSVVYFCDFLKSKHLTEQKQFDIPIKKIWNMKPEHVQLYKDFGFDNVRHWSLDVPPSSKVEKYYNLHEEPDYSKIPKGSIVELKSCGDVFYRVFNRFETGTLKCSDGEIVNAWAKDCFVRVVELAKDGE